MNGQQAGEIMAILTAIFYRETIERETVAWWVDQISRLDNYRAAFSVAEGFGLNADRFPSFREFKQAYQAENDRLRPQLAQIEERAETGRGIPDWVPVWKWLRHNGDFRPLPQQPGWDIASERIERAEYQRLAAEHKQAPMPSVRSL